MRNSMQQEVVRLRIENILLRMQIMGIRKEIEKFVSGYLAYFRDLCRELASIERQMAQYDNNAVIYSFSTGLSVFATRNEIEVEIKRIYRKLVKLLHPDISGNAHNREMLGEVQLAYRAGNITRLIHLEEGLEQRSPYQLETLYNELVSENGRLKHSVAAARNNPACQIKDSIENISGYEEKMAMIKLKLTRHIAFESRRLLAKKLERMDRQQAFA